jgi:hypothetical protein
MGKASKHKTSKKERDLQAGIVLNDMVCRKLLMQESPSEADIGVVNTYMTFRWSLFEPEESVPEHLHEGRTSILRSIRRMGAKLMKEHKLPDDPESIRELVEQWWCDRANDSSMVGLVGALTPSFVPTMKDGKPSPASSLLTSIGGTVTSLFPDD